MPDQRVRAAARNPIREPRDPSPAAVLGATAALAGSGLVGSAPTASAAETPLVTASPAKPEPSPR
ncbi:hypothetical protein ACWGDS_09440 [Streptomyces sp. NPDC055059]|uniref:hypothetical protein n=1 Tax=Streptomyces sp. NPDC127172 TaxID=3345382 RepID=UPI003644FB2E